MKEQLPRTIREGVEAAEVIPAEKIPVVRFNYGKLVESPRGAVVTGYAITRKSTGFEESLPYDTHGTEVDRSMLDQYNGVGALGLQVLLGGDLLAFRQRMISEAGEGHAGRDYREMAGLILQGQWRQHASQLADTIIALRAESEAQSVPLDQRSNYKEPDIELLQHERVSYENLDSDAKYLADLILAEPRRTQHVRPFSGEIQFFRALARAMEAVHAIQPEKLKNLNAVYGFNQKFTPKRGEWLLCLPAHYA